VGEGGRLHPPEGVGKASPGDSQYATTFPTKLKGMRVLAYRVTTEGGRDI